ncbi:subtilase-type protease inhibitor [Kutzneria albida]|uniref:Subtilisin inhibitor domain-containing protein n=1 Tax=Kutzneria albida DSM 43870 TaxID=1449976 RepID=W5W2V6_9PSEU|nr:subtilase-type protease inhibitor [Kutzneria albida]AHH95167.1 hypothetical protein KALB_1796 [Kutzneria albida DSM 43870]
MRRTPLLVCLVAAAVTTAVPAVAAAAPAVPLGAPQSMLVLTISDGTEISPVRNASVLRCDPIGGDHPFAVDSCSQLSAVGGDFRALPVDYRLCSMIYKPVTVSESGYWRGVLVSFSQTCGNECALHSRTKSVFEF